MVTFSRLLKKRIFNVLVVSFLLAVAGILFIHSTTLTERTPPNIILIIGDDISWDDIGCYGNPTVKTPHIDQLAREGLRFTNMYVTSSSCSPSRTSILTGRYPHNTGAAELHSPLPAHLAFFPEQLKLSGYYTALLGKWHEGPATKRAYDTLLAGEKLNGPGGEDQWLNVLRVRPKNKPFFFWLAPFDAHRNWSADKFPNAHKPETDVTIPPTLVDTKETRQDMASYYNEIGRLDHYVGELQQELKRQGIAENTLIVFMADNARPFPGSKTRLQDRGLKTPFLMCWPVGIPKRNVVDALISSVDLAPTLLSLASIRPASSIQGTSFAELLTHPKKEFRKYVFGEHNWHDYEAYERSVRTKDFLYILNERTALDNGGPIDGNQSPAALSLKKVHKVQKLTTLQEDVFVVPRPHEEFYDNRVDSLQIQNRIQDVTYASVINTLRNVLKTWQNQTGDTVPKQLTPDWYDREQGTPLPAKDKRGEMPGAAKKADRIEAKGPF
ncbi:sulfatase [Spirosoma daeguense]